MLPWYVFFYASEAIYALTIEDAIKVMQYEVRTGASYFGMLR